MSNKTSIRDYSEEMTNVVQNALVDLGEALQPYRDDIVLVGGWVPYLLTKGFFDHCGSEDIDLALRAPLSNETESIRQTIETLGYTQEKKCHEFSLEKEVGGKLSKVRVDFLCEGPADRHIDVQKDLKVAAFPEMGCAFTFNSKRTIPNADATATTCLNVADLVSSILMKSRFLIQSKSDPNRESKDFYDVYALTNYNGGPEQAATCFNQIISEKLSNRVISKGTIEHIGRGVNKLRDSFDRHAGEFQVHHFITGGYADDIAAYNERTKIKNQVNQFLDLIDLDVQKK